MTSNQRFAEAFELFTSSIGLFGSDKERTQFVQDCFLRLHRTTQQAFMRIVILPVLKSLAQMHNEGYTDLRNEASCALAAKMLSNIREEDEYLPFI